MPQDTVHGLPPRPTPPLTSLELIDKRDDIERRYKFLVKNFEVARQSEVVKTMGQKHKGRIDEAKARLDEAYTEVRERFDELIEAGISIEQAAAGVGSGN
jgi:hypothetical protein